MNQKSSLREDPQFVSWVLTGNSEETEEPRQQIIWCGTLQRRPLVRLTPRIPAQLPKKLFPGNFRVLARPNFSAAPSRGQDRPSRTDSLTKPAPPVTEVPNAPAGLAGYGR
jgi:hypothetical protein